MDRDRNQKNMENHCNMVTIRYSNCQKKRAATALMVGAADPHKDFILITEPYLERRCHAGFGRKWSVNHSGSNSRAIIASPPGDTFTQVGSVFGTRRSI